MPNQAVSSHDDIAELYQEVILEEYRHPQNYGELPDATLTLAAKNPSCGDQFQIFLKIGVDKKITAVRWQGEGCAISTASLSLLSAHVVGKTLTEVRNFTKENLLEWLGLTTISYGREKCLLIGLETMKKGKENE